MTWASKMCHARAIVLNLYNPHVMSCTPICYITVQLNSTQLTYVKKTSKILLRVGMSKIVIYTNITATYNGLMIEVALRETQVSNDGSCSFVL
jgi:hypothetical protein